MCTTAGRAGSYKWWLGGAYRSVEEPAYPGLASLETGLEKRYRRILQRRTDLCHMRQSKASDKFLWNSEPQFLQARRRRRANSPHSWSRTDVSSGT